MPGAACLVPGARNVICLCVGMGVTCYEDLVAWQLANELKERVYELVDGTSAKRDFHFANQIRDSASSAPANLSEGFALYLHPQFAHRVRIARSEENETHNHLADGVSRGHWTKDQAAPLQKLAVRAMKAATGLLRHLSMTDAPSDWEPPRRRRRE